MRQALCESVSQGACRCRGSPVRGSPDAAGKALSGFLCQARLYT